MGRYPRHLLTKFLYALIVYLYVFSNVIGLDMCPCIWMHGYGLYLIWMMKLSVWNVKGGTICDSNEMVYMKW